MSTDNFPWYSHYDAGTPRHLNYPAVPVGWFLDEAAKKFPARAACVFLDKALSYGSLQRLVNLLSAQLIRAGLQPGDRVAVILPNCPQFVLAFYAIARAGGVVVAINPAYKEQEMVFQLRDSGARFAIVLDSVIDLVQSIRMETQLERIYVTTLQDGTQLEGDIKAHADQTLPDGDAWLTSVLFDEPLSTVSKEIYSDQPVIFQYSGGTTGIPKAAIGTHRNLVANTLQFRAWLGGLKDGEETVLAAIPLFHVYGMVIAMSLGIALGATLVLIPDPRDLSGILSSIVKYGATMFPGVPNMYQAINQNPDVLAGKYNLGSIRACISGAAPLLPEVKLKFEALTDGKLLEGYGLSEAPTATHCNPLEGENRTGSIGLPLPDVEAVIVDIEDGTTRLGPEESGELIIRSPQVMQGYHAMPAETNLALRDGWLYTGDIAKMDTDGYFYLVGRKKELIKIGGFQVWPREIEEVIAKHPGVAECAVAGVLGADRIEMVKAWVVKKGGSDLSAEEIRAWCDQRLARYKVPAAVEFIAKIPKTSVGKILKRELVKLDSEK